MCGLRNGNALTGKVTELRNFLSDVAGVVHELLRVIPVFTPLFFMFLVSSAKAWISAFLERFLPFFVLGTVFYFVYISSFTVD